MELGNNSETWIGVAIAFITGLWATAKIAIPKYFDSKGCKEQLEAIQLQLSNITTELEDLKKEHKKEIEDNREIRDKFKMAIGILMVIKNKFPDVDLADIIDQKK